MSDTIKPFDIASHLHSDADIQAFMHETTQQGDASDFIHALSIAARARGMSEVARQAGVSRASLYKSLNDSANPKFETVYKVCQALGVRLLVSPPVAI